MRISDWSSDVCSSDLLPASPGAQFRRHVEAGRRGPLDGGGSATGTGGAQPCCRGADGAGCRALPHRGRLRHGGVEEDRKSVVSGKSVSVRVNLGGRRIIKKKTCTCTA